MAILSSSVYIFRGLYKDVSLYIFQTLLIPTWAAYSSRLQKGERSLVVFNNTFYCNLLPAYLIGLRSRENFHPLKRLVDNITAFTRRHIGALNLWAIRIPFSNLRLWSLILKIEIEQGDHRSPWKPESAWTLWITHLSQICRLSFMNSLDCFLHDPLRAVASWSDIFWYWLYDI